jgi:excisionase family DNA binding protein
MVKTPNATPADTGQILTDETAAALLSVAPRTIRAWRTRRALPFCRITSKVVRIRRVDLDQWIARQRVAITSAAPGAPHGRD